VSDNPAHAAASFTKMHGAGNDFVVLDATRAPLPDRRSCAPGRPPLRRGRRPDPGRRAGTHAGRRLPLPHLQRRSGDEVEHCGNGARCFVRYVHEHGLTDKTAHARAHRQQPARTAPAARRPRHGRHEPPVFEPAALPFDAAA
jgi:diaminopimelate epimerase